MTVRAAGWTETRPAEKVLRLRIGRYMIQLVRLIDTIEVAPDRGASKEVIRRAV
jgi:hypothetical protein